MKKQKGFSLIFVLAILLVVSFLVASGMRSVKTEMAVSGGDADKNVAFQYAETAADYISKVKLVKIDEEYQQSKIPKTNTVDAAVCLNGDYKGVCYSAPNAPAWQMSLESGDNVLDSCDSSLSFRVNTNKGACDGAGDATWKDPHYIIEPMSAENASPRIYRVTIKAWGKSENTSTIIQAYYSIG